MKRINSKFARAALFGAVLGATMTMQTRAGFAQAVPEPPPAPVIGPATPVDPNAPPAADPSLPTLDPNAPPPDPSVPQLDPNAPRKPLGLRDAKTKTIADVLTASGQFTTLVKALGVAGLTDTLRGAGPFTVFAPSDAAFAKLPKERLAALLKDKKKLAYVLKYHVIAARVTGDEAKALNGQNSPPTLQGERLKLTLRAGRLRVNAARVMKADVDADNGIVHEIDVVLMPPTSAAMPGTAPTPPLVPPSPVDPNAPVTPDPTRPQLPTPPSDPSLPPPPPPFR